MSRWNEQVWLRDIEGEDLTYIRGLIEDYGFWAYVDSQSNGYSHRGPCETRSHPAFGSRVICTDWRHVRGDYCLAANSQLTRCGRNTLPGLPFCGFHFNRVWEASVAFVSSGRERQVEFRERWERDAVYRYYEIDAAAVRDARRILAAQPEQVYFYAAGDAVKVGRSINPAQRVKTLSGTLAPEGVDIKSGELLGTIPGGHHLESALHLRFRPHNLVGEWFALKPIRADIDCLLSRDDELADSA